MRPILLIWLKPKKTFEFLAESGEIENKKVINTLVFLAIMTAGFSKTNDISRLFGGNSIVGLLISVIIFGLIGLFIFHYVITPIILAVGKIFQGKATKKEIKLTIAYSLVPNLIHLVIGVIMIIPAVILDNFELIYYKNPFTFYILWLFSIRILIYGLAYFNKYSYGYALLTFIIPAAIFEGVSYLIGIL